MRSTHSKLKADKVMLREIPRGLNVSKNPQTQISHCGNKFVCPSLFGGFEVPKGIMQQHNVVFFIGTSMEVRFACGSRLTPTQQEHHPQGTEGHSQQLRYLEDMA